MAIFGRFLLRGNVDDVYNILSCVKNFTGVKFFNRVNSTALIVILHTTQSVLPMQCLSGQGS